MPNNPDISGDLIGSAEGDPETGVYATTPSERARGYSGGRIHGRPGKNDTLPKPVALFSAGVTSGAAPLSVTFTNTSQYATSYAWTFGDGGTSTQVNPTHVYSTGGTYSVSLTATGAGSNTLTRPGYISATTENTVTNTRTGLTYTTISAAIAASVSNDTLQATPGTYVERVSINKNLTLRSSVVGQKVVLDASTIKGGGVITITAIATVVLEDIEMYGNKGSYGQFYVGLYVLAQNVNLTARRCKIHENGNGLASGNTITSGTVLMENCEIANNGEGQYGLYHNVYLNFSDSLTLRGCWIHNTNYRGNMPVGYEENSGHLVKSRSKALVIEGCRLTMEIVYSPTWGANRCVDYSNGGDLTVRGCLIEYLTNQNSGVGQAISWGVEGANGVPGTTWDRSVWKVNIQQNTIVSRTASGTDWLWVGEGCSGDNTNNTNFSVVPAPSEYNVADNILCGWTTTPPRVKVGPVPTFDGAYALNTSLNTYGATTLLTNAAAYDYIPVTPVAGSQNWAAYQYAHPARYVPRADNYRGGTSTDFAPGSVANDYNSTTKIWTPTRAPDGRVYAGSWANVPTGEWVQIAATNMGQMDSTILQSVPSWTGKLDWRGGVANNYSGLIPDGDNARFWYSTAGGHTDGSGNNGTYRFDFYTCAWTVEQMPSDRSLWSSGYANLTTTATYTQCAESTAQETIQRNGGTWDALDAAGNAWGTDEVYWDNPAVRPGASPIGVPTSRHTYYAGSYNKFTNELYIGSGAPGAGGSTVRRLWGFSRDSSTWTWKRTVRINADQAINGHVLDDQNGLLRVWGIGDGVGASYTYNLNTLTFDYTSWFPLAGRDAATVHVGRVVTGVEKQLRDYPTRNHYFTYNLDTGETLTGAFAYGGGLTANSFPSSSAPEGQSVVYIPGLNRYWLYTPGLWFQLDPTTAPWTASPLTFPLGTPPAPAGAFHQYNKLMYSAPLNAVISALDGAGNAYVYKF